MKDWLNSWIKWCAIGAFEQNMKIYIWLKSPNIIEKFFQLYSWIKWGVGGAVPPTHLAQLLDTTTWSTTLSAGHNHLVNQLGPSTIGSIIWTKPPGHSHLISWTQSPGQPPCQLDTVIWSTNWTSIWSTTLSPGHLDTTWSTTWSDIHIHLVIRTQLPCYLVTWTKPLGQLDTTTLPTILSTMAMTMNFDEDQQKEN